MVGKIIGPYRIVGQLGHGGLGTVYQAFDETLNRDVVLKLVPSDLADSEIIKRLRADAAILTTLNHPAIASTSEFVHADASLLLISEFVCGQTLDLMARGVGVLPLDQAACIIDEVLSALTDASCAGVVHGDMKPGNVMITDNGVKVMDFGMARARETACGTAAGYMMGTPAYMPPEQALGRAADGRADVYAVGVMWYRLLAGALPFARETAIGVPDHAMAPTLPRLQSRGVPVWCDTILQRALATSPGDRFQTAEEFRETLRHAIARPVTRLTRAAPNKPVVPPPLNRMERVGVTQPPSTDVSASVSRDATGPGDRPPPPTAADMVEEAATYAMAAVRDQHLAGSGSTLLAVIGGITLLAAIAAWSPGTPASPTASTPPASLSRETATPSAPVPAASVAVPAPGAAALSTAAILSAPVAPASPTSVPPTVPPAPPSRTSSVPERRPLAEPFTFEARALLGVGHAQHEQPSLVIVADGLIAVQDQHDHHTLHTVPYAEVLSISYSQGPHPLWKGPGGPAVVARTGGFTWLRRDRHWVSLRLRRGQPFIVLRLANAADATRAITALTDRTGQKADVVDPPNGR